MNNLYIFGTGNPYPIYDAEYRPGDNLYTNSAVALDVATGERRWHFQYTPNRLVGLRRGGRAHAVRHGDQRRGAPGRGPLRAQRLLLFPRPRDRRVHQGDQYVNELTWTAGLNQETGKPQEYDPNLDIQIYNEEARALRSDRDLMKRACPTWHGGIAHQPTAFNPDKGIAYGAGTEGCFSQTGAQVFPLGPDGGIDREASQQRDYTSDLYYGSITAVDSDTQEVIAKAVTEIEIRSGVIATAGGLVFTALQDGWIVAYDDETLQELWRFNVGTPLKGAPVTYAIGPTQYLAVQASGRHLHPVKYDNLENSQLPVHLRPRPVDRVRRPAWCGSSTGAPAFLVRRPPGRHRAPHGMPVFPRPVLVRRPPGRQEG